MKNMNPTGFGALFGALLTLFFACTSLWCQSRESQLLATADRLFNEGNLAEAIQTYDQLIREYPTSQSVVIARFNRGYAQLQLGQFDNAVVTLREVVNSRGATPQLAQLALLNIGKALVASAQKKDPSQRLDTIQNAIAELTNVLGRQPSSEIKEEALYWRALANLSIDKPTQALEDIRSLQEEFLNSGLLRIETRYIEGVALATRAAQLRSEGKTGEASEMWNQALEAFEQVVNTGRTEKPGLANDALFQIAEVLTNIGRHEEAIRYYRLVDPIEDIRRELERRRENLRQQFRRQQISAEQLRRMQERLEIQLASLADRPYIVAEAMCKIAFNFVQTGRYDQARVILNHTEPFVKSENTKKFALYTRIISLALQGLAEKADELSKNFFSKYPKDPLGENIGYLVGSAFLAKRNPERALPILEQSLVDYPNNRFSQEILLAIGQALAGLGKIDEAAKRINDYVSKNPDRQEAQFALLTLSEAMVRVGKTKEAREVVNQILSNPKTEQILISASYLNAQILQQMQQTDEAIMAYLGFVKNYPHAQQAAYALLEAGKLYDQIGQRDKAYEQYKRVLSEYKKSEAAPYAQQAIALQHLNAKPMEADEAFDAFQELINAFPQSPLVNRAKFYQGTILERLNRFEDALNLYQAIIRSTKDTALAADAQLAIGKLWTQRLSRLGSFVAVQGDPDLEKEWHQIWDAAYASLKTVIISHPESEAAVAALNEIVRLYNTKISSELMRCEEAAEALGKLATEVTDKMFTALSFARAAQMQLCGDEKGSLELMKKTYGDGKGVRLSAEDLQRFAFALLKANEVAFAEEVIRRLATEHRRNPAAQAAAAYGEVALAVKKKDLTNAQEAFRKIEQEFAWSPLRHHAAVTLADLLAQTDPQAAIELLNSVIAARTREPIHDIIIDAMFAAGRAEERRGRIAEAAGYYEMVHARFFTGGGKRSVEGLLKAGELYSSLPDKKNEACRVYSTFLRVYGSDPAAEEVRTKRLELQCPQN